jgi:hypothetical protein
MRNLAQLNTIYVIVKDVGEGLSQKVRPPRSGPIFGPQEEIKFLVAIKLLIHTILNFHGHIS